jgi:TolB-like protein
VGRSGELRNVARQRLSLLSRRELEYQARQTLAQEATLVQQPPDPGTIAVMPFNYSGTNEELRPLTRGLAQLVVTDLAKSRQVRVLERERLQAILDEMRLSEESRADPQTAVRSGRLLRAERILTGSFADREQEMRLDAAVVDVTTAGVAAAAGAQDALSRLFDLEKQLVFSIFANLGIQLTDAEREAINQRPTANLQAFLAYSRGLEAEDRGDFAAAQEAFQQAVNLDPNFQVAAQSAGTAGDANQAAQQTVTDVEVVVVQEEPEEVGAPPPEGQDALTTTINELAPTTTSQQQQQQQQVGSTPPGQRDTTGEAGGSEGVRPTTGTIIIIIRRP